MSLQKVAWQFMGFTPSITPVLHNIDPQDPEIAAEVIKPAMLLVVMGSTLMRLQREMKGLYRLNWKLKQMLQYKQDTEHLNQKGSIKQEANNGKNNDDRKEKTKRSKSKKISNQDDSSQGKN